MHHRAKCTHCGSQDMFKHPKPVHQVNLTPGLAGTWKADAFEVFVCAMCGYVAFFVQQKYLPSVREKWQRVT